MIAKIQSEFQEALTTLRARDEQVSQKNSKISLSDFPVILKKVAHGF